MLQLQLLAGNKATTSAVQAKPSTGVPQAKRIRSAVESMPYSEVEANLARLEMQLARQANAASPTADFLRLRIATLERRKAALATEEGALTDGKATVAKRQGRRGDAKTRPATLLMPVGFLLAMPGFDPGKEIDDIRTYLRTGATRAERARSAKALEALKSSNHSKITATIEADRRARMEQRLKAVGGDGTAQLERLAAILDSIQGDPQDPTLMWLPNGSERIPMRAEEVGRVRRNTTATLDDSARKVHASFQNVWTSWLERHETNERHSVVHGAVKWYTRTADISEAEMDQYLKTSLGLRRLVTAKATAGQYAIAARTLLKEQGHLATIARRVEEWDAALVGGAEWLLLCVNVLKEGLTMLATGGAAGIVRSGVQGAVTVMGAGTAAGAAGAGLGSVADQVSSGEGISLRATVGAMRIGGGEGMAIGGGGAADEAFKVAGAATKAGKAVRSIGAAAALDAASAAMKGDSVKTAAFGGVVGGAVGQTLKAAAKGRKAGEVAADVAAGGAKAGAAGGDVEDIAKGAVLGGVGNVVGGAITGHHAHDRSPSTPGEGGGGPAPNRNISEAHVPTIPGGNHGPEAHAPTEHPTSDAPAATVGSGDGPGATVGSGPHLDEARTAGTGDGPGPGEGPPNGAGPDTRFDNIELPSVPMGVEYLRLEKGHFREVSGLAGEGVSGQRLLEDTRTGQRYLFKPANEARRVDRAEEHGIRTGENHSRADAAAHVATRLGIDTPRVRSVSIGTEKGSLTAWEGGTTSLAKLKENDPEGFRRVVSSSEYRRQRNGIDAVDYLMNNVDRGQNLGNLLVELDAHGELVRLIPVDHDLTFTSTVEHIKIPTHTRPLPPEYSPEMHANLERLSADRVKLIEALTPLVGEGAIPGVLHRLDELVADAKRKSIVARRRAQSSPTLHGPGT